MSLNSLKEMMEKYDDQRPDGTNITNWRRSYPAICLYLKERNCTMVTTQTEFDALEIPKDSKGHKKYNWRKIVVSKNKIVQQPVTIASILSGQTKFVTEIELQTKRNAAAMLQHLTKSNRDNVSTNQFETNATKKLDELLQLETLYFRVDLMEFRLADVAYCHRNSDRFGQNFAADQIKSCTISKNSEYNFHVEVKKMLQYLQNNISVTCIGINRKGEIDVVYFFDPVDGLKMLKDFDETTHFHPSSSVNGGRKSKFTIECSKPLFRYAIRSEPEDIIRLKLRKIEIMSQIKKQTLEFWNEDLSQICSANNQTEQKSINMTKTACAILGSVVHRNPKDNYSSVDFRIDQKIRVQDKCVKWPNAIYQFRSNYPYNPDSFDILQITCVQDKIVYAIPMRKANESKVVSTFNEEELMKQGVYLSKVWQEKFKQYKFDLNDEEQIKKYLQACKYASEVPQISDRTFYPNILDKNDEKFGRKLVRSLKALANEQKITRVESSA